MLILPLWLVVALTSWFGGSCRCGDYRCGDYGLWMEGRSDRLRMGLIGRHMAVRAYVSPSVSNRKHESAVIYYSSLLFTADVHPSAHRFTQ